MKVKYKKIIFITISTIIVVLIISFFVLMEYFRYDMIGTRIAKIHTDESGSRHAVVFSYSAWHGYTLFLGVIDKSISESNLIILGPVNYADMPLKLESVVISSDGSVVAAKANFYIGQKDTSYWLAYDFTNSIRYGDYWSNISRDPNLIKARNNTIHELLQSRGGIAKEFSKDDIWSKRNKLSYLEWKRWQKQEDKAKKNCKPWTPADANTLPN